MSGYSGKPLPQKLGIKPGDCVALVRAPPAFDRILEPLPPDAVVHPGLAGRAPLDIVVLKVCAIDETWSGLRLVIRIENRR